jgi:hypothetical protein
MTALEQLERQILELSAAELAEFRAWYARFDADAWDRQIVADDAAGRLDALADDALAQHSAGLSSAY